MKTWIMLLRGINVGGRNRLKMDELKQILTHFDLENIRTYIQSGNVLFQSKGPIPADLSSGIADDIDEQYGFSPRVLIIPAGEFMSAIRNNPFPGAEKEPKTLHLFFLKSRPDDPDLDAISEAVAASERFELTDRVFYLHAPDGVGRSKLASNVENYLGVDATARNWRTVKKLKDMIAEL